MDFFNSTDNLKCTSTTGQQFVVLYTTGSFLSAKRGASQSANATADFYAVPEDGNLREAEIVASYKLDTLRAAKGKFSLRSDDPTMTLSAKTIAAIVAGV